MLQTVIDFLIQYGQPILQMVIVTLLGFIVMGLKKVPRALLAMAKSFETEALKTEGVADDVAAKVLVAFAQALVAAAEQELAQKKS